MEIGFFFWPYHVALVRAMAEAADSLGYDMVGIADTPGLAMDPWVATALLAERTRRARVAVCVTNLVTRHPAVAAASIASVDLLAPGRAVLGVVVAEFFGSEEGLGVIMVRAASSYQVDVVFAGVVVFAALSLLMTSLVKMIENQLSSWRPEPASGALR